MANMISARAVILLLILNSDSAISKFSNTSGLMEFAAAEGRMKRSPAYSLVAPPNCVCLQFCMIPVQTDKFCKCQEDYDCHKEMHPYQSFGHIEQYFVYKFTEPEAPGSASRFNGLRSGEDTGPPAPAEANGPPHGMPQASGAAQQPGGPAASQGPAVGPQGPPLGVPAPPPNVQRANVPALTIVFTIAAFILIAAPSDSL